MSKFSDRQAPALTSLGAASRSGSGLKTRSFVPFGNPWKLEIPVPYSFLVADRELAWTCGQVPLDRAAKVVAPDDLLGQTAAVCSHIEAILEKAGIARDRLGKLVLYYVRRQPNDAERMIAYCRARFGNRPVLVPIAVPYFYFDGLLLEVDAFAGVPDGATLERSDEAASVKIIDAGELAWVSLTVDPTRMTEGLVLLDAALSDFGLSPDQHLQEHWIAPQGASDQIAGALAQAGLVSDPGSLVESADPAARLVGEITYVRGPSAVVSGKSTDIGDVRIVTRQSERFAWFSARSRNPDLGLVAQTSHLMEALAGALATEGMDFRSIVKSTSHYVGGSTADELYENMKVRNGYYKRPGPASTGLPVHRLADRNSRIAVDVLALHDQ